MFTAQCLVSDNKVWRDVGKPYVGNVQRGTSARGDAEKIVSNTKYIHLVSPVEGWTKKQWFNVIYDAPAPVPTQKAFIIYHAEDGTETKFIPE